MTAKTTPRKSSARPVSKPGFTFRNVLAPVDFSESSRRAFRFAADFAKELDAHLTVLHVCPSIMMTLVDVDKWEDLAKGYLAELRDGEIHLSKRIRAAVVKGTPHHEIAKQAKKRNVDLVVVATQGDTGLRHVLVGSTAERIVRHTHCPVLVYRGGSASAGKPKATRKPIRKILVPVDLSDRSGRVVAYAAELARMLGAWIHLVHVVEPPIYPPIGYASIPIKERQLIRSAEKRFTAFRKGLRIDSNLVEANSVRMGSPYREIVAEAKKVKADLVVLSTHGYTGLKHVLLGSTAERVVQHAPVSVLFVR